MRGLYLFLCAVVFCATSASAVPMPTSRTSEKRAVIVEVGFLKDDGTPSPLGTGVYDFKNKVFLTARHVVFDLKTWNTMHSNVYAVFASGTRCFLRLRKEWFASDRVIDIALLESDHTCTPPDVPRYFFGDPDDYSVGTNMTLFGFGIGGHVVDVRLSRHDSDYSLCPQCYFKAMFMGPYERFGNAFAFKGTSGGGVTVGPTIVGLMEGLGLDPPFELYFIRLDLILYHFQLL